MAATTQSFNRTRESRVNFLQWKKSVYAHVSSGSVLKIMKSTSKQIKRRTTVYLRSVLHGCRLISLIKRFRRIRFCRIVVHGSYEYVSGFLPRGAAEPR